MNSTRRDLLDLFTALCDRYPEMRFGQLVANFASLAEADGCAGVYDIEDEALAAVIREHLQRAETLQASPAA